MRELLVSREISGKLKLKLVKAGLTEESYLFVRVRVDLRGGSGIV